MTAIKHHSSSAAANKDRNLRSSSKSSPGAGVAGKRETDDLLVSVDEVEAKESRVRTIIMDARKHLLDKDAEENTLIPTTPPKKAKVDINPSALGQGYKGDNSSYSDTMTQMGSPPNLSLSPLKLSIHTDGHDEGVELDHKGKQKAVGDFFAEQLEGISHEVLFQPITLSQDDNIAIDLALSESKRIADASAVNMDNKSASSSAAMSASSPTMVPVPASIVNDGTTASSSRRTFKGVMQEANVAPILPPMISSGEVLQDDLMRFRVRSLPDNCEVNDQILHDPLLIDDYKNLPKLRAGVLSSWSNSADDSNMDDYLVAFSQWARQCPGMDYDLACAAVSFTRYKHFVNPSRASPLDVNIQYTTYNNRRSSLYCNYKVAICLSPMLSNESHLLAPAPFGLKNKFISGYFHQQEWQRFKGFSCMVFDKPSMVAQIFNSSISFTTFGSLKEERGSNNELKTPRNPAIFSIAATSKSKATAANVGNAPFKMYLNYKDDVPIFDARNHPFNFGSDLEHIADVLPRYQEEVPSHSFVVVGYTMTHSEKERTAYLSTNIQFVILMGTE